MPRRAKTTPQNKKILRKILLTILILGTLGLLSWLTWNHIKTYNFPIKHVKIFATYEHVDQNSLQKTISNYLDHGFLYLNVSDLKQQLLKSPWIYAVSIKRKWPDTVIINIAEQRAILQWGEKALMNPDGKIFAPPKTTFPKDLTIVFGPEEHTAEIFTTYYKMLSILEPLSLTIKKLELDPKLHWEITLNNNTVILLKSANALKQLELLTSIYRKITAEHEQAPKSIDMRYQSGMAVKW